MVLYTSASSASAVKRKIEENDDQFALASKESLKRNVMSVSQSGEGDWPHRPCVKRSGGPRLGPNHNAPGTMYHIHESATGRNAYCEKRGLSKRHVFRASPTQALKSLRTSSFNWLQNLLPPLIYPEL